ncbi:DUF3427 domain-containing protein [Rhizobium laguerreae]|uniref:DUF3427 domain-containing protein n=1 Tax=Rhizobium laguerreae TaxID=1076926 RepID=UPI001C913B05|nr:DUF3427 domain-containing protein [Rhizobium laguerreae]MBY3110112.1 DUF3427 domain-containing protein [Rhizobium laguerreae]
MAGFSARKGDLLTRSDIQDRLGVPSDRRGGDWSTGYTRYENEFFVFANVDAAGRTGHDYENRWENDGLIWFAKTRTSLQQQQIKDLISGVYPVHVFYRSGDRQPFVYAGRATPVDIRDQTPVRVTWTFQKGSTVANPKDEIAGALVDRGFHVEQSTKQTQRASKGPLVVYIKQMSGSYPLVISPEWKERLSDLIKAGGERPANRLFYHNATMRSFPIRSHGGEQPIQHGIDFEFSSRKALDDFLDVLTGTPAVPTTEGPIGPTVDPETETEATRAIRLGQQKFRDDLIEEFERCPISGIDMPELLRASHIKPWSHSSNKERIDGNNGILLAVHIDILFDKGLMTFDGDGKIIFSSKLSAITLQTLGAGSFKPLGKLTPERLSYLEYHRGTLFKS